MLRNLPLSRYCCAGETCEGNPPSRVQNPGINRNARSELRPFSTLTIARLLSFWSTLRWVLRYGSKTGVQSIGSTCETFLRTILVRHRPRLRSRTQSFVSSEQTDDLESVCLAWTPTTTFGSTNLYGLMPSTTMISSLPPLSPFLSTQVSRGSTVKLVSVTVSVHS